MKIHTVALATLAMLGSSSALGAGTITATIISVRIDQTGNGMAQFSQNLAGTQPGCVIGAYQNSLAFNTNTAAGKAIYAMALAAKAQGNTVTAYGLGTCSVFGSAVEDWDYGIVQ